MATNRPANKRLGTKVAKSRADARGAEHTPDAGYFDVDDEQPVEVKTTARTVESGGETRKGRYQLVGDNHDRLVREGGEYDFVLRRDDGQDVATLEASEVDEIINEAGLSWPQNSKLKLRYDLIHE